jgi:hypothetical protein
MSYQTVAGKRKKNISLETCFMGMLEVAFVSPLGHPSRYNTVDVSLQYSKIHNDLRTHLPRNLGCPRGSGIRWLARDLSMGIWASLDSHAKFLA